MTPSEQDRSAKTSLPFLYTIGLLVANPCQETLLGGATFKGTLGRDQEMLQCHGNEKNCESGAFKSSRKWNSSWLLEKYEYSWWMEVNIVWGGRRFYDIDAAMIVISLRPRCTAKSKFGPEKLFFGFIFPSLSRPCPQ
jgi:hypothetical protein